MVCPGYRMLIPAPVPPGPPGRSPCEQSVLGGGEEVSCEGNGSGVCRPASGLRIGGREVGTELDAADVVDSGPVQPVLEVGLLEVVPEARAPAGAVDRAGVDHGDTLVLQQPGVARSRVEAEDHAGLADDV